MMLNTKSILLALTALFACSSAFVSPSSSRNTVVSRSPFSVPQPTSTSSTTTALAGRRWNFNEGQAPWGLKRNAEIWNGRVSQMAFTIVFIQELIQGKGVVAGLQEGDPVNQAVLAGFVVTTLGLTAWLAIKGNDDYTKQES